MIEIGMFVCLQFRITPEGLEKSPESGKCGVVQRIEKHDPDNHIYVRWDDGRTLWAYEKELVAMDERKVAE